MVDYIERVSFFANYSIISCVRAAEIFSLFCASCANNQLNFLNELFRDFLYFISNYITKFFRKYNSWHNSWEIMYLHVNTMLSIEITPIAWYIVGYETGLELLYVQKEEDCILRFFVNANSKNIWKIMRCCQWRRSIIEPWCHWNQYLFRAKPASNPTIFSNGISQLSDRPDDSKIPSLKLFFFH